MARDAMGGKHFFTNPNTASQHGDSTKRLVSLPLLMEVGTYLQHPHPAVVMAIIIIHAQSLSLSWK